MAESYAYFQVAHKVVVLLNLKLEIPHIDDLYLFTIEDYRLRADDDRARTQPDLRGRFATLVVQQHYSRSCNSWTSGRACPRKSRLGETSQEAGNKKNGSLEDKAETRYLLVFDSESLPATWILEAFC